MQEVADKISSSTVTVCSPEEKASLKTQSEALDSAAEELGAALEAVMEDLASMTRLSLL